MKLMIMISKMMISLIILKRVELVIVRKEMNNLFKTWIRIVLIVNNLMRY
jgi:hypothetical protein